MADAVNVQFYIEPLFIAARTGLQFQLVRIMAEVLSQDPVYCGYSWGRRVRIRQLLGLSSSFIQLFVGII